MKNFTNNFKQFTSRLSARWLIMALMLLLGTGSIWGAQKALYLNAGGSSLWDQGGAKFVAYVWADGVSATWHEATKVGSYYQVMVSDKVTKVIWLRKDPSGYVYNNWTCWNRVGDVTGMDTNNLTTVNGWNENSFKTSYYDDISTYTVSGTDNAVKLSDSDKWVTYTLYKDGTVVTSSAKTGTGSALSWTVTDGGEYTVKGTNTYKTEDMSGSYTYSSCTPQSPTFVHTNSSYNEISTPTYYLGDKAYFKSTINCCLTSNWSKTGTGTYKTLTGSTPNFYLTLSSVGSFTLTNAATDGCDGSTSPSISFTTQALPNPTAQSASISGTTASLSWTKDATYTTVMVVRYAKDATPTAPTQGTAYTAGSSKIGNGTVVYKGTGTSYANTGLTTGSSYDYYFYTVNNNYYSAGVTATAEACTSPNVQISNLSSTTLCTGGSLTFNYTAAAGAVVKFKMGSNPNSFTVTGDGSNSGIVTIKYNSSTSINGNAIKYDVSGTGICQLSDQSTGKTIKCGPVPSIAATSAPSFSFCPGDAAVTLSVTAGQGTYSWAKNGDVIAGKTTNSIEVSDAGTYTVFVVGTGGCESNTVTFTVNGNGGPKVHASGATALGTNKFAALYVTDCSGKEIDTYQWESCRTQAGTYDNYKASVSNSGTLYSGDAGTTNNIRPETLGFYRCKVTYKDGSTVTSDPVQVTGSYTHTSSTLPVIIVNTNGVGFPVNNTCQTPSAHADDMKEKVSVDVKIYDGSTMVYDRKARMNYRGSSSLNFLKKSYAFCPGKDNCVEDKGRLDYVKTEKMNMLGIGEASDKDWVLYAAAADPSLMRNRLMFDTFRDMTGGWSVNSRYVELYVDGVYKGVYVMMDKITNNKKRVNITASNGFIVKFDKTDLADRYEADGDKKTFKSLYSGYDGESGNGMDTYDTFIDQRFEIEYPEMEDVEEDNPGMWAKTVNDIKTLFNNFESNLKAGNYAEVQKIIDYTSWADWFIISEYAKNMDAYRASCMFVYNGGKIEARPLWDQELSFNNQCANLCSTYGCNSTTGLLIENSKIYEEGCAAPFWFTGKYVGGRGTEAKSGAQFEGYLLNDPCFIAVLKERWALHTATGGALTQDVMNAKISGYEKDLGSVGTSGTPLYRERNTYWSGKSRKTIDKANSGGTCFTGETGYQDTEISTSISAMKSWITGNRRTNLGTLITNMKGSPLSISFEPQEVTTTPWEPVTLQVINTSSYDYTITYTDGELDKQSGVIINKTDDTFKINVPRPSTWPAGDEEVEDERADITYGIKATLNVADGTTVCGKSEVTPATATIILKDEPNENCPQP
ncbi:MAG: CotH kinase family protein [Paludibacteraceae bacterium]|nr:CotH kinase family protein [Paludibacteraceae bacterium]